MKSPFSTIRSVLLGLVAAAMVGAPAVLAATTNYGNYIGTSVSYLNVGESSGTDGLPLFGAPTVSGNTLTFDPTFTASANNGSVDLTDGQLNMHIAAAPGNVIPSIMFNELGDFHLLGPSSALTYVEVSATFFIKVLKIDGIAVDPINYTGSMSFAPSAGGHFDLATYPGLGNFWSGNFNFDLNTALTLSGISYVNGATEVSLALDNTLAAVSQSGTIAFIAKKVADAVSITVPQVPEPSTLALTLFGVGLIAARRRSR